MGPAKSKSDVEVEHGARLEGDVVHGVGQKLEQDAKGQHVCPLLEHSLDHAEEDVLDFVAEARLLRVTVEGGHGLSAALDLVVPEHPGHNQQSQTRQGDLCSGISPTISFTFSMFKDLNMKLT